MELALLLPVVVLLLLAVLQVGLLARDAVLVTHAAREAARAAAVDPTSAAARRAAAEAGGLDPDRLHVELAVHDRQVTVAVTYRAPTEVPLVGRLLADRTIEVSASMRNEALP